MSRQLPARPNLEHLKSQAKDRLRELKQRDASTRLADAQHVLAREYGFATWSHLKAHVVAVQAAESQPISPFVGHWHANVERSDRHPLNPFRSASVQFEVMGDSVRITDVTVDETGRAEQRVNTIHADGIEHPSENGHGFSIIAGFRGSRVLQTIAKKDGAVVGWGTYEISADDRILVASGDQMRIVFERSDL